MKKGNNSVGVARQYCGTVGKVENGQVAVFAGLSTENSYALIDAALFLPQEWTTDLARCKKAGIPKEFQGYKSKPELAIDIIKRQQKNGIRFDYIAADGLYGNSPDLLNNIDAMGLLFVVDVHSDQRVYLTAPIIRIPEPKGIKGRKPTVPKIIDEVKAVEVRDLITNIPKEQWEKVTLRKGTKEVLLCSVYVKKIYTWEVGTPEAKERLLIIRKSNTSNGAVIKYALSNAREGKYTNQELAQMQAQRYFIERTFQDAKQQAGMSQYQVRGWLAWHHHIALVMLALEFILKEKILFKNEFPLLTANDIREVFINVYAVKGATIDEVMKQMKHRHKQRKNEMQRHNE